MDITGTFLNSFEDDNDGLGGVSVVQAESKKSEDGDDNESFQIVNGSVILTPRKGFQSDSSSDSECDSSLSEEGISSSDNEELNETRYVYVHLK